MRPIFLLLPLLISSALAASAAPAFVDRSGYAEWLAQIGSKRSPYYENLFRWLDEQVASPLPAEVHRDPDRLWVTVDRPLRETILAEESGAVHPAVTYGLEAYAVIDAPIETVLQTILFRWGKPLKLPEGVTYPIDTVFSFREEKLSRRWDPNSYQAVTTLRGGGLAKDQNDVSSLLVRGSEEQGYLITAQFLAPNGKTLSTSSMSFVWIRPLAGGKTDFRVSGRYTGQSYLVFGIDFGRRNYGFNLARLRVAQLDFIAMVGELRKTGKIRERRPSSDIN